jgi:hypothetical protein
MRTRLFKLLLTALALTLPTWAYAQEDIVPRTYVGPLSHPRYESGGFYTALEFLYMKQRNTIGSQVVATRGFIDVDGSITGFAGTYVGTGTPALNTSQLGGPETFSPGFNLTLGYRFESGLAVQASWWHLADVRLSASASVIAPNYQNGPLLQDTFLTSPVFNVPGQFAGNLFNTVVGNPGATFGIWNASSFQQISFVQRFDMVDVLGRIPITETENYRSYGYFGPRAIVMWERFKWRTVDVGAPDLATLATFNQAGIGNAGPNTIANYTNVVSNRLYGLVLGCGNEFYLGNTPVGAFSLYADVYGSLYGDFVKGRARYSLEDRSIAFTYARNMFTLAPGFDARVGFQWYIYEAICIRLGYNYLGLINTVASPNPIDFNLGQARPAYQRNQYRSFDGLDFGIGFVW